MPFKAKFILSAKSPKKKFGKVNFAKTKDSHQKKRGRMKKKKQTFCRYINIVLKQMHPDISITKKSMIVMDNFMTDIFKRIANEASLLVRYAKKLTIRTEDIQTAVRLILPGELAKHAMSEGNKAVAKYKRDTSAESTKLYL